VTGGGVGPKTSTTTGDLERRGVCGGSIISGSGHGQLTITGGDGGGGGAGCGVWW